MAKRATQSPAAKKPSPSNDRGQRGLLERSGAILGRTLTGAEDVGREVGSTAVAAVRGSMHAAEQIGSDLVEVTKAAVEGTLQAAERIGTATTRAVRNIIAADGTPRRSAPMTGPRRRRRGPRPTTKMAAKGSPTTP